MLGDGMKLKLVLYMLVFLLILSAVEAGTNLKITGARCHEEGRLTITTTTKNTEPTDLTNTTIKVFHNQAGWSTIEGLWNKDEIKLTSTMDKTATYTSTFGALTLKGMYDVYVYYEDCTYPPCDDQYTMFNCPGFTYSCNLAELEITKAFQRGEELWIQFNGININQYEKLNVEKAIRISVDSNSRTMDNKPFAGNMELKPQGEDAYTLIIPLGVGEKVYNAALAIAQCKEENSVGNPTTFSYEIKKPIDLTKKEKEQQVYVQPIENISEENETEELEEPEYNGSTTTIIEPVKTRMSHTGLSTTTIVLIIIGWTVAFIVIGILLFIQLRKR